MTSSGISRRSVAKGAAWAAPAVLATATVPAYAASQCVSEQMAVSEAFEKYHRENVPNLEGSTLRLWWGALAIHDNGALHAGSILRAQWSGTAAELKVGSRFGFEIAQRNVDTSEAVNVTLGGKTLNNSVTIPNPWPATANWDRATGETVGKGARQVDTPTGAQRDVSHGSSFLNVYQNNGSNTNLGSAEVGEETGTPKSNALTWLAAIDDSRAHFFKTLTSGNIQDIFRSSWRDGSHDGGTIFTSMGVRPIAVLPPTLDQVKALISSSVEYNEDCLSKEYKVQYTRWIEECRGLGGLTVEYSQWGNGTVQTIPYTCGSDFIWSHVTGAFYTGTAEGAATHLGTAIRPTTDVVEFFNRYPTAYAGELQLRDGIW